MNLKEVDFEEKIHRIDDANRYLISLIYGKKVADSMNPWKDTEDYTSLFEFCDENNIDSKKFCKYVDDALGVEKTSAIVNRFCDFSEDQPESLDDTIVETVEHNGYSWDEAIDILDVLLTDEEKQQLVSGYAEQTR